MCAVRWAWARIESGKTLYHGVHVDHILDNPVNGTKDPRYTTT